MVEDVVPMVGTSRMIDDEVPISVSGSSRMVENQMPVGTFFSLSNAKHGGKYWNRSRGKLDFKESSGKDYGTYRLN